MQSVHITSEVVSSVIVLGAVYTIQVCQDHQVGRYFFSDSHAFFIDNTVFSSIYQFHTISIMAMLFWFPPPIKLTAMICMYLTYC
jgi:hypothetical protein